MYSIEDVEAVGRLGGNDGFTVRPNSRATMTFCRLPPDRDPTSVLIDGVRMSKSRTAVVAVMTASGWNRMPVL
jgi:hypothetical protein